MPENLSLDQITSILGPKHDALIVELGGPYPAEKDLFHYTTLDSLTKIAHSSKLRMTDARFCNDPDELTAGLSILRSTHDELAPGYKENNPLLFRIMTFIVGGLYQSLSLDEEDINVWVCDHVPEAQSSPMNMPRIFAFIFCMSERGDDLRQWMPYGDNGKGAAIKLNAYKGGRHFVTLEPSAQLLRVSYKPEADKVRYVKGIYRILDEFVSEYIGRFDIGELVNLVRKALLYDIICCKNHHYEDEMEWRLVVAVSDNNEAFERVQVMCTNGVMKPYIDVELLKDSVMEVKLGPQSKSIRHKLSCDTLLRSTGYDAKVEISSVRYGY